MQRILACLAVCIILSACTATDCDEDLDTCDGRGGFQAIWSEDDQMLALVVKDFGDTLAESDNTHYLYTLNADGNDLKLRKELAEEFDVKYINHQHQYIILEKFVRQQYADYPVAYHYYDIATDEESELGNISQATCHSYRVIPSLDGNHLAVLEALEKPFVFRSAHTPRKVSVTSVQSISYSQSSGKYCNPLMLRVRILNAETMEEVGEITSLSAYFRYSVYFSSVMEDHAYIFWTPSGLVVQGFYPEESEYSLIDIAGNVSEYTLDDIDCYRPVTSSSEISEEGLKAEVYAFYGLENYAEIQFTPLKDKVPLCQ